MMKAGGKASTVDVLCVVTTIVLVAAAAMMSSRPARTPVEYQTLNAIWDESDMKSISDAIRAYNEFPNAVQDVTSVIESVGEETPLVDGACENPLMVPNKNNTLCVFAQRMDVGSHYVKTGGNSAFKEPYESLVSRLMAFARFFIASEDQLARDIPFISKIFDHPSYRKGMQRICPGMDKLDPFQLGIIAQVPGQTVAIHYDAPWFYGADRRTIPIWLLVVMDQSGLFKDITVSQIQGVAYIHSWNTTGMTDADIHSTYGGGFFFYPEGPNYEEARIAARPGSALLIDGSKCIHGTDTYHPHGTSKALPLSKESKYFLRYAETNTADMPTPETLWNVVSEDGELLGTYKFNELRISLVWRSKCFQDEDDYQRYLQAPKLKHEDILATLKADLVKKGYLKADQEISVADLGVLLLKVYVDYPLPAAYVPFNYCALPRLASGALSTALSTLLRPFCG